jgi:hypothetical protein
LVIFFQKKKEKRKKSKMKRFWNEGFTHQKWRGKKITRFLHFFQCVAINIKAWLKICISYLIYSQIWLYGPRDDC